jgi:OOP family OmpA-OmpF porin
MTEDLSPDDASASVSGVWDELKDAASSAGQLLVDGATADYHYAAGAVDSIFGDSAGASSQFSAADASANAAADDYNRMLGVDPINPPPPPPGTPPMDPIPPNPPPDLPIPDPPPDEGTEGSGWQTG